MTEKPEEKSKWKINWKAWAILMIILGFVTLTLSLFIVIPYVFQLNSQLSFLRTIDSEFVNVAGTIGVAISGGLWALGGVLLFFDALDKQREQIKLQSQEMEETRSVFQRQLFEQSFFNLINIQNEIRGRLEADDYIGSYDNGKKSKQSAFNLLVDEMKREYRYNQKGEGIGLHPEIELPFVQKAFESVFNKHRSFIGQYFRNLYSIIEFVDSKRLFLNSDRKNGDAKFYMNLLKSQMSSSELSLVFYHALMPNNERWKQLIIEYKILENLPSEDLINPTDTFLYTGFPNS